MRSRALRSPVPLRVRRIIAMAVLALSAAGCGTGAPATDPSPSASAPPDGNRIAGCVEDYTEGVDYFPDKVSFEHAGSVSVSYADHYKVVTVEPAANEGDVPPVRFVLVQCGTPVPEMAGELEGARTVQVPVRELASLTTTNLPHLEQLDAVDTLVGVAVPGFVSSTAVVQRIEQAGIEGHVDASGQPDIEKLVALAPDVVVMDAFGADIVGELNRLGRAGVPAVLNADFNEHTLLGRAEWVKFTALLLNAEAAANAAFEDVRTAYEEVRAAVPADAERPEVFVNTPYEGTWFAPGGGSYLAQAIEEAGGEYALGDDESTFSLQLDVETVLEQAADADVWLQAGSVNGTLADLAAQDERFTEFRAFREGAVWAYDKWTTPGGGNAVFEVAYARPDLFLADLARILHPEALPEHDTVFFGQVPQG